MLDSPHLRERQREWTPNPDYFSKWKILFEAELHEEKKKKNGILPDGDHVYYVAAKVKNETFKDNTFLSIKKPLSIQNERKIFTKNKNNIIDKFIEKPEIVSPQKLIKNLIVPKKLTDEEMSFIYQKEENEKNDNIKTNNIIQNINFDNINDIKSEDNNEKKEKINEKKKITYEDVDHTISEIPHQIVLTHEFLNKTANENNENKNKKEKENENNDDSKLFDNVDKIENIDINQESGNLIINKNILNMRSAVKTLDKLNNQTLQKMFELDKNLDKNNYRLTEKKNINSNESIKNNSKLSYLNSFRFQDRRKIFIQTNENSKKQNINTMNSNNLNIISNTNIIANLCPIPHNCPNKTDDGNISKKHLTYYDVKHPTTRKIVDKNKGIITTVTDLGTVTKTIVLKPEEIANYQDVEHALDNEFAESDKIIHTNDDAQSDSYNKKYDLMDSIGESEHHENKGSTSINENNTMVDTNYTYNTSIDINSPKQFLIKRVQTNKKEGIDVNEAKYEYGKTLNNYDYKDVYKDQNKGRDQDNNNNNKFNIPNNFEINVNQIQEIRINNEENKKDCCMIEPCIHLTPCFFTQSQEKLQNAFISSFLQLRKSTKLKLHSKISDDGEKIRKRSRFPDPQWNCVKGGVTDIINYLCEQEISNSFKKYCVPLKEQINIIIETILFHDSLPTMCKRINMCFYSK